MGEEVDCSFRKGDRWFRLRACGILLNEGKVLMVRNKRDPYYYSLGGGVLHGEEIEQAAVREVFEETGCRLEIDRLAFIHENFFIGDDEIGPLNGLICHELAFYYLMKWNLNYQIKSCGKTIDGLAEELVWLEIDKLSTQEIPVYPKFFETELLILTDAPKHIVTRE
ncbi:MAG: NUDIX domain-containing protein [Chloroflexi bacterium]|nr:NUDIX domain-containing protein [Chloroflexota bacterium]